jgi:lysophospholipase L1-like esterase
MPAAWLIVPPIDLPWARRARRRGAAAARRRRRSRGARRRRRRGGGGGGGGARTRERRTDLLGSSAVAARWLGHKKVVGQRKEKLKRERAAAGRRRRVATSPRSTGNMRSLLLLLLAVAAAASVMCPVAAHGDGAAETMPINLRLGVPGFPDCERVHQGTGLRVEQAAMDLVCTQRQQATNASAVKIGCVGDSITAGVHSSGGIHPYPQQLQLLLDQHHKGQYAVTNMGACGSMLLKNSSSPFWQRPQMKALTQGKWDIVVIMLGTNDAHNTCSAPAHRKGCSSDWNTDCGGPNRTSLQHCQFATDFTAMVDLIKTLGTTHAGPEIYLMTPPPLMSTNKGFPTMQTTINTLFPKLIPQMVAANPGVKGHIDMFSAFGGVPNWPEKFPSSCVLHSPWPACPWWCDKQSCDQCHPDDNGYAHMAKVVYAGLGFQS